MSFFVKEERYDDFFIICSRSIMVLQRVEMQDTALNLFLGACRVDQELKLHPRILGDTGDQKFCVV